MLHMFLSSHLSPFTPLAAVKPRMAGHSTHSIFEYCSDGGSVGGYDNDK